jgi:hypothetical protein
MYCFLSRTTKFTTVQFGGEIEFNFLDNEGHGAGFRITFKEQFTDIERTKMSLYLGLTCMHIRP